jgi:ribosome-binding protein aMBF1 (putative translation factor)
MENYPVIGPDRTPIREEIPMGAVNLREMLMRNPEYRRAHFEGEPILRVAVHVIRFRNEAGLTQEELAERMEKRQSWISRVEAGEENLTMKTLGQLAYALEKDPAEFLESVDLESAVTA